MLPQIIVSHPSLPVTSLKEFIALARRRPGEIFFASTGNGSANHLGGEMLNAVAGLKNVHVPYKGAAPALTDLLAGQVQFMFTTIPPALPHVKTGKLRALAVAHARRSSLLPDLPTTAESGAPGVEASSWNGVLAPAGTPRDIIARLHTEISAVMKAPGVAERLASRGSRTDAHHARRVRGLHRVRDCALCESRQRLRRPGRLMSARLHRTCNKRMFVASIERPGRTSLK